MILQDDSFANAEIDADCEERAALSCPENELSDVKNEEDCLLLTCPVLNAEIKVSCLCLKPYGGVKVKLSAFLTCQLNGDE
jgi:hypothetical protein